jgi:hypothetical protein
MPARHLLIVPFDSSTYPNPSSILPTIYRTVLSLPSDATHFSILFATPGTSNELYPTLQASPEQHWTGFQSFLGKVYACLAAAQWSSGNILLDVEIAFKGEKSRVQLDHNQVIVIEGEQSCTRHLDHRLDEQASRIWHDPPLGPHARSQSSPAPLSSRPLRCRLLHLHLDRLWSR